MAPHPCHRLDLNTSGVLVFAKSPKAATDIMSQFEASSVTKTYAALCQGHPTTDVVDAPLCKVAGATRCERRVCGEHESGQSATSTIRTVAGSETGQALVLVQPQQGRTHQVRVHLKAAGAAIIADDIYDDADARCFDGRSMERHALHALALTIRQPSSGKQLEILAPLPTDMLTMALHLRLRRVAAAGLLTHREDTVLSECFAADAESSSSAAA